MNDNIYKLNYSPRENVLAACELLLRQRLLKWVIIVAYIILLIISILIGDPILNLYLAVRATLVILALYIFIIRNDAVNIILRKKQEQMQLIINESNIELTNQINSIIFRKEDIYKVQETLHYYWIHFWNPWINIYIPKKNNNREAFCSNMEKYFI